MRQILTENHNGLLIYDIAPEVTAFSPLRNAVLPMRVVQAHQVHGDRVAVVTSAHTTREELEGYDALVTDVPGVAIGARTADCIPVLMYDPVRRVVAAVHSGWKGTVLKIAAKTLAVMASKYGSHAADILAVIGRTASRSARKSPKPSSPPDFRRHGILRKSIVLTILRKRELPRAHIHPALFTTSPWKSPAAAQTLHQSTTTQSGSSPTAARASPAPCPAASTSTPPQAVRLTLIRAGVHDANILISGIDTYTHPGFFSARREGPSCGRTVNTIMLNP